MADLAVATYQRVSKKEQANDSEAFTRQGWQLDRAVEKFAPNLPRLRFEDIQTGRRDDRPGFLKLIEAIEAGKVGILIVTRLDRLARDLETSAKIQKIMERQKIKIYETTGKSIDWNNSNDWSYYAQAGVDSERESRKLSERIIQTYEWQRSQGKLAGGMVGFPYRRDTEGHLIPDSDNWQKAIDYIKIVIDCGGANMKAIERIRQLGDDRTRAWLSNWIRSPLIRGHIPVGVYEGKGGKGRDRRKKKSRDIKLFRDAHANLFADPQLAGTQIQIDRIIADASRYKGRSADRYLIPLSGLVWCARCGNICHLKTCTDTAGKKRIYAICGNRNSKGIDCGGKLNARNRSNPVNTRYEAIEAAAFEALIDRAAELIQLAARKLNTEPVESPEIAKLRQEIDRLTKDRDPDLAGAIAKKTERLNGLILANSSPSLDRTRIDRFIDLFASGDTLALATETEKRVIYRDWIAQIEVDRQVVTVRLTI